ncbi:PREDICTED: retinoic acid receptor responder protein 1 isoform X2 [Chinchilla lanigera]|uniref:retinoic acid receptor responder protein 1 isoform X2 n=1 Tax=Chinchilla lanigera TaxID=34839 RepID=UPI000698C72A|nr:PREDICTED: retinoic acid receptor responder protein 1 isoform X2 [Chinchilla lanigera]
MTSSQYLCSAPPPRGKRRALVCLTHGCSTSPQVDPKRGCKVDVVFSTERYNQEEGEQRLGKCSAHVFFKNQKPRPAVNVTCTRLIEKKKREEEDQLLYKRMKQLKVPLDAASIPEHFEPACLLQPTEPTLHACGTPSWPVALSPTGSVRFQSPGAQELSLCSHSHLLNQSPRRRMRGHSQHGASVLPPDQSL